VMKLCDGSFLTICKNCSLTRSRSSPRCKRTLDRFILLGQAASRSWVTGRASFEREKRKSLAKYGCRDCPMKRHYRIFFPFLFFIRCNWPWPMIDWSIEPEKCDDNRHVIQLLCRLLLFMRSHFQNNEI